MRLFPGPKSSIRQEPSVHGICWCLLHQSLHQSYIFKVLFTLKWMLNFCSFWTDWYFRVVVKLSAILKKYTTLKDSFCHTYVENFYLLKIHLNLFEIPNQVLKFENLKFFYPVWKFISNMDPAVWCHVRVFKFTMW